MKKNILFAPFLLLSPYAVAEVEQYIDGDANTLDALDSITSDIELWENIGNLEAIKKKALADQYDNIQLNDSIKNLKENLADGSSSVKGGEVINKKDLLSTFYEETNLATIKDGKGATNEQSEILSSNSELSSGEVDPKEDSIENRLAEIDKKQSAFFEQIQDYVNNSVAEIEKKTSNSMGAELISNTSSDLVTEEVVDHDFAADESKQQVGAFDFNSELASYAVKIKKRTPKTIELAFSVAKNDDLFLGVEKITNKTKRFNLILGGEIDSEVEVLRIEQDFILLKIGTKSLIAR